VLLTVHFAPVSSDDFGYRLSSQDACGWFSEPNRSDEDKRRLRIKKK